MSDLPVSDLPSVTLVAIAKNEGAYILEWLAFHLSVGFSQIVVYDNESADETSAILMKLSRRCERIVSIRWPSIDVETSPQTSAYNHALKGLWTNWAMFLDIDEFVVPFGDGSMPRFLERVPADVSSVHVNWRGFGSNGLAAPPYGFVTTAFTRCAPPGWGNNSHFKSLARSREIERVFIHNVAMRQGSRVLSDLGGFETLNNGQSDRIVHDAIQINHYQCKTYDEFRARMDRGDANYHPKHRHRPRDSSRERFGHLDVNDCENVAIAQFHDAFLRIYARLQTFL